MIEQLNQEAFVNFLQGQTLSIPARRIYAALDGKGDGTTRKKPCILIDCQNAQQDVTLLGDSSAQVSIELYTNIHDTPAETHGVYAREIMDKLTTDLPLDLSAAKENYTCLWVYTNGDGYRTEGDCRISYLSLMIGACASDLPP